VVYRRRDVQWWAILQLRSPDWSTRWLHVASTSRPGAGCSPAVARLGSWCGPARMWSPRSTGWDRSRLPAGRSTNGRRYAGTDRVAVTDVTISPYGVRVGVREGDHPSRHRTVGIPVSVWLPPRRMRPLQSSSRPRRGPLRAPDRRQRAQRRRACRGDLPELPCRTDHQRRDRTSGGRPASRRGVSQAQRSAPVGQRKAVGREIGPPSAFSREPR
jgi:hypothetical protein